MSDFMYDQNGRPISNYSELPDKKTDAPVYVKLKSPSAPAPADEPKKKTKKNGISVAAAIVLCVVCVLLSCGAGFAGAYLYFTANGIEAPINTQPAPTTDDPVVIHKHVTEDVSTHFNPERYPYATVVSMVVDCVVEINTEYMNVSAFYQYISSGAGSGVIISDDGYILTNNHVIANLDTGVIADSILVRLRTGEEFPAEVIGRDDDADIAILKINAKGLPYATLGDSDKLVVGEEVLAVGNPLGQLGGTVTNGIISALGRDVNVEGMKMKLLQTNAAVNPGNSGGGLFNMQGELIGIVNAGSAEEGVEGIGFAIPINDAYSTAEQLLEFGYVKGKPYIGVAFQLFTNSASAYYYFGSPSVGVYVTEVLKGFNHGNIEVGDRVMLFDGQEVSSTEDIKYIIQSHEIGDTIEVTVIRNNKAVETKLTVFEKVPDEIDFEQKGK